MFLHIDGEISAFCVYFYVFVGGMDSRYCGGENCHRKLPSADRDGHSLCDSCKTHFCTTDDRCDECREWDDTLFATFERCRLKRKRDRMYSKEKGRKGVSPSDSFISICSEVISPPSTQAVSHEG